MSSSTSPSFRADYCGWKPTGPADGANPLQVMIAYTDNHSLTNLSIQYKGTHYEGTTNIDGAFDHLPISVHTHSQK